MKAFAFISAHFDTGVFVRIISEEGYWLSMFETRLFKKEKIIELAKKFCPETHDFEWIQDPQQHAGIFSAVQHYEEHLGCTLRGYEISGKYRF
jgi:hypothetical protein